MAGKWLDMARLWSMRRQERASTVGALPYPILGIAFAVGCAIGAFMPTLPLSVVQYFLPASRAMLAGGSPFAVPGYYNPPWTLLPFMPFAILHERVASGIFCGGTLAALVWLASFFHLRSATTVAYLLSLPAVYLFGDGGLDAIVLAVGLALRAYPWWALLVLSCKPQVTVGVMLWLLWQERRNLKRLALTLLPTVVLLAVSLALYGPWPLRAGEVVGIAWRVPLWPWGMLIGVLLLLDGYLKPAVAASPLLAPYANAGSLVGLVAYVYSHIPWWGAWFLTAFLWALAAWGLLS